MSEAQTKDIEVINSTPGISWEAKFAAIEAVLSA